MNKILNIGILVALIALAVLIGVIRVNTGYALSGDTGQIYMILQNIYDGMGPHNQILPSLMDLSASKHAYLTMPIIEFCKNNLSTGPFLSSEHNHFQLHTYFVMYLMSAFVFFFKVPYVINVINTLAFILFIYISFRYASKNIKWYYAIAIITVVAFHPAWSWSFIGQPYIDKIFLPLGLLIINECEKEFNSNKKIFILIILAGLIVEKVIIYVGIYLLTTSILNYKNFKNKKILILRILFSVVMLLGVYFGIKLFMITHWYGSAVSLNVFTILNLLQDQRFFNGFITLLIVSAPLLIPSLVFRKKLFIIAFGMLVPNLIGTIGGAEKVGFFTHYHTLYFPFLVYGFIFSCNSYFTKYVRSNLAKFIGILYLLFSAVFYILVGFNSNLQLQFVSVKNSDIFIKHLNTIWNMPNEFNKISATIDNIIPKDAMVSTIEPGWPYLYKHKDLVTYPFNIKTSDFLIVNYTKINNSYTYYGYISYLGKEITDQANACLMNKIENSNFDTANPVILNSSMAILKKVTLK